MKVIAWLAAIGTLITAAIYMVVSLNRWEWNRALFFAVIVVIAEIGLGIALVLRRLSRLEDLWKADQSIAKVLRDTRPPSPDRFAWLRKSTTQTNVFITFLVGGGVVVAGIAWIVDRVAGVTSTPVAEHRLAAQLTSIRYPTGGLLVDDITALAQDMPGADDEQIRKLLRRAT